jgi:predicted nucleotidyltransferase
MTLDIRPEWVRGLCEWAARNDNVRQLWLFGSRARGDARPDSDVDIALALMPADAQHDWAYGCYCALGDEWQRQLGTIVGRHVSLETIKPDTEGDAVVRGTGRLLWERGK